MANIILVKVFKNNNGNIKTHVRYESGRQRNFSHKETVAKNVVLFKMNSNNVETTYTSTGSIISYR